jgi:hypothetical protein
MARELLDHKAEGYPVNISLITAVVDYGATRDERFIKLLVNEGADVNFENGKAIDLATQSFDVAVLDVLLAGKNLAIKSLIAAFTSAMALRPSANRFIACKN